MTNTFKTFLVILTFTVLSTAGAEYRLTTYGYMSAQQLKSADGRYSMDVTQTTSGPGQGPGYVGNTAYNLISDFQIVLARREAVIDSDKNRSLDDARGIVLSAGNSGGSGGGCFLSAN